MIGPDCTRRGQLASLPHDAYTAREFGSASKSYSKFLVAVTVWIASLLSITLFQIDLGFSLQLAMEISVDKLFDLTGVVKHTVLWCLGGAPIHAVTVRE